MNQKQIEILQRQLRDQGTRLGRQQGTEAVLSVLDACAALLRAVAPEVEGVSDREDFEDLFAGYYGIAEEVGKFARLTGQRFSPLQAEELAAGTAEDLDRVRGEAETARANLNARKREIEGLHGRIQEYQKQLTPLETEKKQLEAALSECTPERLAALQEKNEQTRQVLDANGSELKKLKDEAEALNRQLTAQQQELDQVPQEMKEKRARFEEKRQMLEELKNGKALYAPEKLDELQAKIDRLTRDVSQLSVRFNTLKERHEKLTEEKASFDQTFPALERETLEAVKKALDAVRPQVDKNLDQIERLRDEADTVTGNLDRCEELRKSYHSWLDATATPLKALMDVMDETESQTLRDTLDVGQCRTIRELMERAKEDLRGLDRQLETLMNAYHKDVVRIQQGARNRG